MNICVFCGSGKGHQPIYADVARTLGTQMANAGHTLVYGGGNIGLMGVVADAVMDAGGKVTGVIPDFLFQREVGHRGISELVVVGSMHERKHKMAMLADAFVALPGGLGTLDELAEILTWRQLHLVSQPVAILNTRHFFDHQLKQLDVMVAEGFLSADSRSTLQVADDPASLLALLAK